MRFIPGIKIRLTLRTSFIRKKKNQEILSIGAAKASNNAPKTFLIDILNNLGPEVNILKLIKWVYEKPTPNIMEQ